MEEFEYTNRLKMPLLVANQSGKETFHNEAIVIIDNMLQNCIISKDLATPPEEPEEGDVYIVAENATGDWLDKDNNIAFFDNGWRFIEQQDGFTFFIKSENCFYTYSNEEWEKTSKKTNIEELKNINFTNLTANDFITYDGENFVNTQDLTINNINLNNINISDKNKFKIEDDNLTLLYNNNDEWVEVLNVNNSTGNVNFKNGISINSTNIDDLMGNNITTEDLNSKLNKDLDNLSDTGINNLHLTKQADWSRLVNISSLTSYTVPEDGYLYIYLVGGVNHYICYKSSLDTTSNNFTYVLSSSTIITKTTFNLLAKDEILTRKSSNGTYYTYFLPLKTI